MAEINWFEIIDKGIKDSMTHMFNLLYDDNLPMTNDQRHNLDSLKTSLINLNENMEKAIAEGEERGRRRRRNGEG